MWLFPGPKSCKGENPLYVYFSAFFDPLTFHVCWFFTSQRPIFEGHFEPLLPRLSFLVRWSYFLVNDVQSFESFGPNQLPTLELDVENNGCSQIAKGSVKLTSILDGWKFSPDKILPNRIFVHSFIYPVFLAVDVCANSASSCHDSPEFQSKISCKAIETGIVYVHNTLTDFRLKCFKIMASKSGFLWKIWYCSYAKW